MQVDVGFTPFAVLAFKALERLSCAAAALDLCPKRRNHACSIQRHSAGVQAAITRAKAVKALGAVVQASQRLLKVPEVQESVSNALQVRRTSWRHVFSCAPHHPHMSGTCDEHAAFCGRLWLHQLTVCDSLPLSRPQDEAISVREAALELLGRHMDVSPDVAAAYFQHIVQATLDVGVSVRKRAVRILWDCCIRCSPAAVGAVCVRQRLHMPLDPPDYMLMYVEAATVILAISGPARSREGFEHSLGACVALLQRADDAEESIRDMVSRVFHGLWFAAGAQTNLRPASCAPEKKFRSSLQVPADQLLALLSSVLTWLLCLPQRVAMGTVGARRTERRSSPLWQRPCTMPGAASAFDCRWSQNTSWSVPCDRP